jgi:hypothetical protein
MNQPLAIENGIPATTTVQSKNDSFRVQVPEGWVIQDVNNSGPALGAEVLQGHGILAQLCPEEEQRPRGALTNASGNTSSDSNSNDNCQGAQDEVIYIVQYPNLGARLGLDSDDIISNESISADAILEYQMQKLQEVGYRDIRILNSTDAIIDIVSTALNNSTIGTVPARLVEMTYSTNLNPSEIRQGYLLSTATAATPRNLEIMTGYAILYEGDSAAAAEITPASSSLSPLPPTPVRQVFDSFELILAPELEQALLASLSTAAAEEEEEEEEEELTKSLTAEINSNDTEAVAPATFEFEADIAGGTEPYTIGWDLGDDGIIDSNLETIVVAFNEDEAGTYDVTLYATDIWGQIASDSIEITLEEGQGEDSPAVEEPATEETVCDSSYPDVCIPPPPPTLTCDDVAARNFKVSPPDPHGFDDDNDSIGCESRSNQPDEVDEPDNSGSNDALNLGDLINRAIGGGVL